MRLRGFAVCGLLCGTVAGYCDGPGSRTATDPKTVLSGVGTGDAPLPVEALLTTTRIGGVTHSNGGKLLAYISSASGRPNLWVMNVDGSGARQLIKSEDRQTDARFTKDDSTIVYSQDKGGNEYSDIYGVAVSGGEPKNLTHTDEVDETVDEFSPDGTMLAIGVKQKSAPSTDLAVMTWPGRSGTAVDA